MTTPTTDVECTDCGHAFTSAAAYAAHRPGGGPCARPASVGLVVAPRIRLTWSVPVKVPTAVDMFGNPTEHVETDPEVAGMWDARQWHGHP